MKDPVLSQRFHRGKAIIKCPICGIQVDILTKAHVEKHGMTKDKFLQEYPNLSSPSNWGLLPMSYTKQIGVDKSTYN